MSGNLVAKVFFEIGEAQTSKFSALLWWDILESNEGNGISFEIFFPDATETVDVFLNCFKLLFLNVMRWVDRDSRNWRSLISFGTRYIVFLLYWRIIFIYIRYVFFAAPPSLQRNMDHHHFLLRIQWSGLYFMWSWSATSTDPIKNCKHEWHWDNEMSFPQSSSQFYYRIFSWWEYIWQFQPQLKWCALYLWHKYHMQAYLDMFHHPSSPPLLLLLILRPVSFALHFLLNNLLRNILYMCPSHTMQHFISAYAALNNFPVLHKLSMYCTLALNMQKIYIF